MTSTYRQIEVAPAETLSLDVLSRIVSGDLSDEVIEGIRDLFATAAKGDQVTIGRLKSVLSFCNGQPRKLKDMKEAANNGMPMVGALLYLSLPPEDMFDIPVQVRAVEEPHQYGALLLITIYEIIIRGMVPTMGTMGTIARVIGIGLKYSMTPAEYFQQMGPIPASVLNWSFIQGLKASDFGPVLCNRFKLGIAGYRYIRAIAKNPVPDPNLLTDTRNAYELILYLASQGHYWDLHPMFKTQEVLNLGSISDNLVSIIYTIYTEEEIAKMVMAKMLPAGLVQRDPRKDYVAWPTRIRLINKCPWSAATVSEPSPVSSGAEQTQRRGDRGATDRTA